jgi:hypothetical protein
MVRPVRFHARFPCDLPVDIHTTNATRWAKPLATGRISNISMGGIGVWTEHLMSKGVPYEFRFQYAGLAVRLTGRVVWEMPKNPKTPRSLGFGISLTMSVKQENTLKVVIDRIRAEQSPDGDDRMKNYWSV